jgi:hypothetical protein
MRLCNLLWLLLASAAPAQQGDFRSYTDTTDDGTEVHYFEIVPSFIHLGSTAERTSGSDFTLSLACTRGLGFRWWLISPTHPAESPDFELRAGTRSRLTVSGIDTLNTGFFVTLEDRAALTAAMLGPRFTIAFSNEAFIRLQLIFDPAGTDGALRRTHTNCGLPPPR